MINLCICSRMIGGWSLVQSLVSIMLKCLMRLWMSAGSRERNWKLIWPRLGKTSRVWIDFIFLTLRLRCRFPSHGTSSWTACMQDFGPALECSSLPTNWVICFMKLVDNPNTVPTALANMSLSCELLSVITWLKASKLSTEMTGVGNFMGRMVCLVYMRLN